MKKEEEKSYGIAAGRDLSSGVVGPCPNGAPSHDVDASYRHNSAHNKHNTNNAFAAHQLLPSFSSYACPATPPLTNLSLAGIRSVGSALCRRREWRRVACGWPSSSDPLLRSIRAAKICLQSIYRIPNVSRPPSKTLLSPRVAMGKLGGSAAEGVKAKKGKRFPSHFKTSKAKNYRD